MKLSIKTFTTGLIVLTFLAFSVLAVSANYDNNYNHDHDNCNYSFGHNDDDCRPTPTPKKDCDDNNWKREHKDSCVTPTVTPTPTPKKDCDKDRRHKDDDNCKPTPTPTIDPCSDGQCVTPTVTPTPTKGETPVGGPGDGLSDGRSSCPSCTQAPSSSKAVLGASTGPQVLGLSTTSGEESALPLIQLFGSFISAVAGYKFLKK